MNKRAFMNALETELIKRYGMPGHGLDSWACDQHRLAKFMDSVKVTLTTPKNQVRIDSDSFRDAWRAIGGKGKPTYKGLRALEGDL